MPGQPIYKADRIDKLIERFAVLATDFDALLPSCYRFSGKPPTRDARANAWARTDEHIILAADALSGLQAILHQHAMLPAKNACATGKAPTP